eukprot:GFYU01003362.1.p1 GENE.GFYU01003362.1~~GFYU01003362.1.p1  ORF type:complete len:653 (+),score=118.43 GFYU01003362.1:359-2317(+)
MDDDNGEKAAVVIGALLQQMVEVNDKKVALRKQRKKMRKISSPSSQSHYTMSSQQDDSSSEASSLQPTPSGTPQASQTPSQPQPQAQVASPGPVHSPQTSGQWDLSTKPLSDYLANVARLSQCGKEVLICAMVYMDRLAETGTFMPLSTNIQRVLLACIVLAAKMLIDGNQRNKTSRFATIGGLSVRELISTEKSVFQKLGNGQLFISGDLFQQYARVLKDLCREQNVYKQRERQSTSPAGSPTVATSAEKTNHIPEPPSAAAIQDVAQKSLGLQQELSGGMPAGMPVPLGVPGTSCGNPIPLTVAQPTPQPPPGNPSFTVPPVPPTVHNVSPVNYGDVAVGADTQTMTTNHTDCSVQSQFQRSNAALGGRRMSNVEMLDVMTCSPTPSDTDTVANQLEDAPMKMDDDGNDRAMEEIREEGESRSQSQNESDEMRWAPNEDDTDAGFASRPSTFTSTPPSTQARAPTTAAGTPIRSTSNLHLTDRRTPSPVVGARLAHGAKAKGHARHGLHLHPTSTHANSHLYHPGAAHAAAAAAAGGSTAVRPRVRSTRRAHKRFWSFDASELIEQRAQTQGWQAAPPADDSVLMPLPLQAPGEQQMTDATAGGAAAVPVGHPDTLFRTTSLSVPAESGQEQEGDMRVRNLSDPVPSTQT